MSWPILEVAQCPPKFWQLCDYFQKLSILTDFATDFMMEISRFFKC